MNNFNIQDYVVSLIDNMSLKKGSIGIVKGILIQESMLAVEWNDFYSGTSCNGLCKTNSGLFVNFDTVKLFYIFKLGDYVEINDKTSIYNGFKGLITSFRYTPPYKKEVIISCENNNKISTSEYSIRLVKSSEEIIKSSEEVVKKKSSEDTSYIELDELFKRASEDLKNSFLKQINNVQIIPQDKVEFFSLGFSDFKYIPVEKKIEPFQSIFMNKRKRFFFIDN